MYTSSGEHGADDGPLRGDADISLVGAALADPGRCRMLLALDDGRALPASRLAAEAGVATSTASHHLATLLDAGLLAVEPHGRVRYYRLAGPEIGQLLEVLIRAAPVQPIRSLRQSTQAKALRHARTCYDHLAGRLGVALMRAMIEHGHVAGGDGTFDSDDAGQDKPSGYGRDVDYILTDSGRAFLDDFGVVFPPRRTVVRYCVDWSEQRHHLAGGAGRGLLDRLIELDWVRRAPSGRAVHVTASGRAGLTDAFGLSDL